MGGGGGVRANLKQTSSATNHSCSCLCCHCVSRHSGSCTHRRRGGTAFILTSGALTKMSPISALTQYGWRELATRVCLQAKFGSIMTGRELVLASLFTGPPCIQFYRGTRSTLRTINVREYLKTPTTPPSNRPTPLMAVSLGLLSTEESLSKPLVHF